MKQIKLKKNHILCTWKVPFLILSISLSCNSIRLILFRKWKDVSGSDLILLLLKSKCCRFVRNLNGAFGISETEEDRAWDILNVRSEWPTWGNLKLMRNESLFFFFFYYNFSFNIMSKQNLIWLIRYDKSSNNMKFHYMYTVCYLLYI